MTGQAAEDDETEYRDRKSEQRRNGALNENQTFEGR